MLPRLPLRKLEPFPRPGLTRFFAFLHSGIACSAQGNIIDQVFINDLVNVMRSTQIEHQSRKTATMGCLAIIVIVFALPPTAVALPILDQANEGLTEAQFEGRFTNWIQEIIPGIDGTLTGIELDFQRFSALDGASVGLRRMQSGVNDTFVTITGVNNGWTLFDFSAAGFEVFAGEAIFANVVTFRQGQVLGGPLINSTAQFDYPGRLATTADLNFGVDCFNDCSTDFRFRTFVEPATGMPAPGALALFYIGLAGWSLSSRLTNNSRRSSPVPFENSIVLIFSTIFGSR